MYYKVFNFLISVVRNNRIVPCIVNGRIKLFRTRDITLVNVLENKHPVITPLDRSVFFVGCIFEYTR